MTLTLIKSISNPANDHRVLIVRLRDHVYRYEVWRYVKSAPEDEGWEIGWVSDSLSGLYQTAEDAEMDARQAVPWLRAQSST